MNRLERSLVCLICVVLFLSVANPLWAQQSDVSDHPMIGDAAPAIELETTAGEKLSLAALKGSFVVVHFGASW